MATDIIVWTQFVHFHVYETTKVDIDGGKRMSMALKQSITKS